jgi:hypothetical protein
MQKQYISKQVNTQLRDIVGRDSMCNNIQMTNMNEHVR